MNTLSDTLIVIEPWQAALYRDLSRPLTLNSETGSLNHFDGHRRALHARGEADAAAGIATPLRLALLKLTSVDAASRRALARKVKTLAAHRWAWVDHPMTALLIEVAIVSDATALGLDKADEERMLRQLRGQP